MDYGATTSSSISVGSETSTTVFTPPSVTFPLSLTAGQTFSTTWNSKTTSVITINTPIGKQTETQTSTSSVKFSVKLVSATTQSVTVPAGTYKAYELDETISTTISGKTTTATTELWCVSGVGVVKSVTGAGSSAVTTELTKFKA